MRTRKHSRLILALPAIGLGAYGLIAAAPGANPQCQLTADPIRGGEASGVVKFTYTEDIGDSLQASVTPASKVMINSTRKGATPLTGEFTANSEQAVNGEWEVTVNGMRGTCVGKIQVVVAKKKSSDS